MVENYTGRARITNKKTGASRKGVVTGSSHYECVFREDGATVENVYKLSDFTIEPILPPIPSEPGDTFTADVTRGDETKRVVVMVRDNGTYAVAASVGGWMSAHAQHIDRATIESVITAKERGL